MKDFIQWLKADLPTEKWNNVKELQETRLLGIYCELLMQEKVSYFSREGCTGDEKLLCEGTHSNEHSQDML